VSDRPTLALLAAPGTSNRAVPLLGLLGLHAEVVSWQRRGDARPDAVLATSVESLAMLDGEPPLPVGVWVRHHDEIDRALRHGVDLLLTGRPELVARGALLVPPVGIEVDRWPVVPPLVRARRRARLGLPAHHVVGADEVHEGAELEEALGLASAAVVSGPATLLALALGTPIVTSSETARRLGVRPGRDVEVAGDPTAARALAQELAGDEARCASLSRRARRCAEHHLDLGRPARVVAERLGISLRAAGPAALVRERLETLGTPASSPTWPRVEAALAVFGPGGGGSTP
jgi:hypothetical protein